MIVSNYTISFKTLDAPTYIPAVQGDTGRELNFSLADYTIPAGATARYYVQKPSGLSVYNDATISGNAVTVALTAQSLAEAGYNKGQVRISLGDEVITSFEFILDVMPFRGIDAIESTTETNIFDQAVADAEDAIEAAAEEAVEYISENIDDTLSIAGKAADAKATGDGIRALETKFEIASGQISSAGKIETGSSSYKLICFKVTEGEKISAECYPGMFDAYAFYENKPALGSTSYNNSKTEARFVVDLEVPGGCKWIVMQTSNANDISVTTQAEAVDDIQGAKSVPWNYGRSITTNGTTVNLNHFTTYAGIKWAVVSCSEGDKITINGTGGSAARLWCFADAGNNVISVADENITLVDFVLTAPKNSAYLVINTTDLTAKCYIGETAWVYPGYKKLNVTFEQGSMNGAGADSSSTTRVRTPKIYVEPDCIYAVVVDGYKVSFNADYKGNDRKNYTAWASYPFSIARAKGFIRLIVANLNTSSTLSINDFDSTKVSVYKIRIKDLANVKVALSNQVYDGADVVLDATDPQDMLQALVGCTTTIGLRLGQGTYNLTKAYTTTASGQKACLLASEFTNVQRFVGISGEYKTQRNSDSSTILMAASDSIFTDGDENSIILVPRMAAAKNTTASLQLSLKLEGLWIIGDTYEKSVISVDATQAKETDISHLFIRNDGTASFALVPFATMPSEDCVGIRAGHGSNAGSENKIESCRVFYCGKGYSICGEHYILQDCLAHHCKIGFAFGDENTRTYYEHPNVMIGCSIEGCYRLMLLTRYGATTEEVADRTFNTLVCSGLSTEVHWTVPTDEATEPGQEETTLPILEIIKGAYRGRIELDHLEADNPFEQGSGTHLMYTLYNRTGIHTGTGNP